MGTVTTTLISLSVQMGFPIASVQFKNKPTENIMNHAEQTHLQMQNIL